MASVSKEELSENRNNSVGSQFRHHLKSAVPEQPIIISKRQGTGWTVEKVENS